MINWRLRHCASGGTKQDWKYSTRPLTTGMRSFCLGLMMSSTLSLVMAMLCFSARDVRVQ